MKKDDKLKKALEHYVTTKVLAEISSKILQDLEQSMPKWKKKLTGNCKDAYEGYIKTILEDKEYIKKAKDISKEDKEKEWALLEAEQFYAECLFVYIQNYYYLKNKTVSEET